ncbi:hypothetical protein BDN72DRAFT_903005 [Pluteus cervinus]|uniref:Uncharacterized protein n=1 Tax=Pluteus cervinus TaxID=181527 RepID=A0ACD3AAT6_9AGAR|nr:hypothetical protein BDN72DRAFT_903005 [Pluteus cervinus]
MSGSSTAINDPFLLATYAYNQRVSKKKPKKAAPTPKHVYASHEQISGKSEGFVTIAAQGDGVHVLDVASLRPVISHTLGPTTSFSCPAISSISVEGSSKICHSFAVVEASSDIGEDENGRVIWMWRDPLSPSLADTVSQKPKSFTKY